MLNIAYNERKPLFFLLGDNMREAAYQNKLIKKLQLLFPNCFILKNDPSDNQGIPDILILFGDRWGVLETKISSRAHIQPNQDYYIDLFNDMSFAAFICPENERQVLDDLQFAFGLTRSSRLSQSK